MEKNTIEVRILGSSFSIQSDNEPNYLEEVVAYLGDRIEQIKKDHPTLDPLKISLMASLNIVDELFKIRKTGISQDALDIDQIAEQMINRIDESLDATIAYGESTRGDGAPDVSER